MLGEQMGLVIELTWYNVWRVPSRGRGAPCVRGPAAGVSEVRMSYDYPEPHPSRPRAWDRPSCRVAPSACHLRHLCRIHLLLSNVTFYVEVGGPTVGRPVASPFLHNNLNNNDNDNNRNYNNNSPRTANGVSDNQSF